MVVASSAVIGAAVNATTSLVTQHLAWKREQAKLADQRAHEAAKQAEQRAPAQLEVALMLEDFMRQAVGYLDAWDARFTDWLVEQHGEATTEPRPWSALTFDTSLVEHWSAVTIDIQSQCREFPLALAASSAWVGEAYDEWADFPDLCWLEGQRATLYGLQVGELAAKIRETIAVPMSNLTTDSFDRLQREFDRIKRRYVDEHGKLTLIPDLKARLQRECPQVAKSLDPVDAPAGS
ncbi:hypothetical protein WS58_16515 [Burkholderia pseudomultivorans]|nr:hypothetical protein WS57_35160 [Burkholderia pseudomultivorans]KVC27768.1 hypothetical protein WS55_12885 [Burkholderia pseudomultivorans]KVC36890.1 hypothetical protein WS56_00255 [Burkholderia pseudomultivorans]KVC42131.1 hypothetical protein WS58_16515 [Burkholderia pseudomultivorans]